VTEGTPVRRRKVSVSGFLRIEGTEGNLADRVSEQIRGRIEQGRIARGERLPSERDLADELGVSRTVLRESLRTLESLGYLEARVGQGRFVTDPRETFHSERLIDDWLRRNRSLLRDLVELRAAIESQALRGGTGDPVALAEELSAIVAAQERAIAEGRPDDAAQLDTEFHLRLSASTPNAALGSLAAALIGQARKAARATYRVTTYTEGSLGQHRAILAALASGDRARAATLLHEHHVTRSDQVATYLEREDPDA